MNNFEIKSGELPHGWTNLFQKKCSDITQGKQKQSKKYFACNVCFANSQLLFFEKKYFSQPNLFAAIKDDVKQHTNNRI